ncbi:MAG: hypothetical protein HY294_05300 [Candidatus Rokubacteria bacterium]|nr:hypothetical protein [Candidatus Rokubacteria bacterium]MBI3825394.1 hypothetical protein [Candidatus Rokubacteria bacterium]
MTADPWAFLSHLAVTRLDKRNEDIANAYISQGNDFFEAAQNPRFHSRPLLYYYAFLNVVKAALLIRRVPLPPLARHGINDPRANSRQRLRFAGQTVNIQNVAADHSEIFPEFVRMLGHPAALSRSLRVIDLLRFVPSIHRTFTQVVASPPIFVPVARFEIRYRRGWMWARLRMTRTDRDVHDALPGARVRRAFTYVFSQVESERNHELWFETTTFRAQTRGTDNTIAQLAALIRGCGIAAVLTAEGYRFYLVDAPRRLFVPYLAAMYAIIFYLGSITRYKPDVFDKIISGKQSWIIEEFLAALPTQFLFGLASELAGVDVVRPYAAIS